MEVLRVFLSRKRWSAAIVGIVAIGTFVAVATIGTIVLVVPISWLGDRCGKTPVLLGCYAVTALGLLALPFVTEPILLGGTLFIFGACAGAMYPLGLALLTDRMPASGLARAYAWYLAIECVGSQLGAAAAGKARDIWDEAAMFPAGLAAIIAVLAIWATLRALRPGEAAPAMTASENKNVLHNQQPI